LNARRSFIETCGWEPPLRHRRRSPFVDAARSGVVLPLNVRRSCIENLRLRAAATSSPLALLLNSA
ncbi:MAG: hypothetical protein ACK4SA_05260, partial [Caldilinea sp.]